MGVKVESYNVVKVEIEEVEGYPVSVFLEDEGNGVGRLIIAERGRYRSASWDSMESSLVGLFIFSDNDYLISRLSIKPVNKESFTYKRLEARLNIVRDALIKAEWERKKGGDS